MLEFKLVHTYDVDFVSMNVLIYTYSPTLHYLEVEYIYLFDHIFFRDLVLTLVYACITFIMKNKHMIHCPMW